MALLEVCCGDIDSVRAAIKGGASRVELCSALSEGGVTPSAALICQAVATGISVNVLIRPRGGDFLYSADERHIMKEDIRRAADCGASGVVIGALRPDGFIDTDLCRRLVKAAGDISVTFHRAFDMCRDPEKGLEEVIGLGCHRILTSGGAASATEGADTLRMLNQKAGKRIIILAGGGVNPDNAAGLIRSTGVKEIHASARTRIGSLMEWRREGVAMGSPDSDEYSRMVTSPDMVADIIRQIKDL